MKKYVWDIGVVILCLLYAIAGSLINLHRLWQYELGYYDFGFFAVSIWKVSQFQLPTIDHFVFSNKIIFADHFNPSIFLFAPLFWITSRIEILLVAQCVLVGISGYVLYRIGLKKLQNKFLSLSVVVSYFLFIGLQNAVYSDFHELTVMSFFLTVVYWAIIAGKKKLYILFFILTLGFKESLFLLGIGLSIFVYFYRKEWRRLALLSGALSLIWGFVVIKMIIGFFSGGKYNSSPELGGGVIGVLSRLVLPIIKVKTVLWILVSFLFLPLLAPATWSILVLNFVHRFLNHSSTRWDLGLHYNAEIAPTLAVATILGLAVLQKKHPKFWLHIVGVALIVTSLFLHRFIFRGPIGLAYNPAFYAHTSDFKFLDKLVSKVPKNARVSAQNNLTPPFFHGDVWILRDNYRYMDPEYIVIDARAGQNPSNYLGIKDIKILKEKIAADKRYEIFYHEGDQYIFKKK